MKATLLLAFAAALPLLGASWGAEERLTTTSTDSETGLNHTPMTWDESNVLHVVWAEQDGVRGNYQIYTRRRAAGVWGTPALVVPFRPEQAGSLLGSKFPSIVCAGGETLHVAWHDYRIAGIDNSEIYYKKCAAASAWDTSAASEVRLTTTNHPESGGDNGYVPTLKADRFGDLHLVWYDFRFNGSAGEILYKARTNGGWDTTPGDQADLNLSGTTGDSQFPVLAVDSNGNAHVLWQDDSSGNHRILYAMRNGLSGTVTPPIPLTTHAAAAVTPALAVDAAGTLHAAWVDSRDGARRIYTRSRTYGASWTPERPATPPGLNADEPALAVDGCARVWLTWHDTRVSSTNREIFVQMKPYDAEWDSTGASDFRVSNGSGPSIRPSIAYDSETNRIAIVWKDRRDGNNEIYFREAVVDIPVAVGEGDSPERPRFTATVNPFAGATRFRAADAAPGTPISIFDTAGRPVRTGRTDAAGGWTWDGRDAHGLEVQCGVYFVRPQQSGDASSIKVVKVR